MSEAEKGFRRQWCLFRKLATSSVGETLTDLAAAFDCTTKTIQRDLALLRSAGVTVVESCEKFGKKRWRIAPDTTRIPKLQWDEAASIYLGRRFLEPMAGSLFWEASQQAFAKLKATFTPEALAYIEKISSLLFQTTIGVSDYSARAELIDTLMTAIEDRVTASIEYHSIQSDGPKTSDVHPLGFVYHDGSLYLVAFTPVHDGLRHYKIDRLLAANMTQSKFTPPDGFRLDEHLAPSFGVFHADEPIQTVRILFRREAARYVTEHRWHHSQTFIHQTDGSVICEMQLANLTEVQSWILSFGPRAEAMEPTELREAIKDSLLGAALNYDLYLSNIRGGA